MQQRKGTSYSLLVAVATVTALGVAVEAMAAPTVTGALLNTRVFNDDGGSTLNTINNFPTQVQFDDTTNSGAGFANLHNFHLASDFITEAVFNNGDSFDFSADLTISGDGQGEGGLQVAPWWSHNVDGRFNFRTTDGEIAVFGGRLPFYSFTGSQGLTYTKGDTVNVGVKYRANGLSSGSPATIEYLLTLGGNDYTSGPLAFDEGNAAEGMGTWGMLDDARVGGYVQYFTGGSGAGNGLVANFGNMSFVPEPASLALLAMGAVTMLRRRR
ncbi:MAG TPA: PEP-CTERM sorting domain-containing protein [Phycisphaerae bacterium]|nr:PEP-CTERM sorting domain-containing protein [Phycisphaerae bacterium]